MPPRTPADLDPAAEHARQTQQSYDQVAARFLERTRDRTALLPWMRAFKAQLPDDAWVVDLGAGPCLDSAELRALGLRVISVDRSRAMLNVAREQIPGLRVQADMRRLPFRARSIAGAWASASLLHLERDELVPALLGIREMLNPAGVLFMSLKHGEGAAWDTSKDGPAAPRWFTYWPERDVDAALRSAGFDVVAAAMQVGPHQTWIVRIART